MPDHEVIFSELSRELKGQVSPFVALLHSKDCTGKKARHYHQCSDHSSLKYLESSYFAFHTFKALKVHKLIGMSAERLKACQKFFAVFPNISYSKLNLCFC